MLVGRIIIHNQMQVQLGRGLSVDLLEETNKLLMPVAGHAVANHLAIQHAERGEQGRGPVALVVVGHRPATPLLHRQTGLGPVQSLDLALLVDAQHQGPVGRVEIETDHIPELLQKVLVSAQLEGLDQMRPEVVLFPDALNCHAADPLGPGHAPHRPMGGVGRLRVQGGFHHRLDLARRKAGDTARPGSVFFQARQPESQKTLAPQLHGGSGNIQGVRLEKM